MYNAQIDDPPQIQIQYNDNQQIQKTTCPICYQKKSNVLGIQLQICKHWFCQQCLGAYLQQQIQNRGGLNYKIVCPYYGCQKQVITTNNIKQISGQDLLKKYLTFKKGHQINSNPDLIWCPVPDCQTAVKRPSNKNSPAICQKCKTLICFNCGHKFHGKSKCRVQQLHDPSYKQWADSVNAHYCPRCRMRVQKESGCDSMKCTLCQHSWCYRCGLNGPFHAIVCRQIKNNNKSINFLKVILLSILFLIGGIVLSPLLIVIIPFAGAFLIWITLFCQPYRRARTRRTIFGPRKRANFSCCQCFGRFIGALILSILFFALSPFLVVILILIGVPVSIGVWIYFMYSLKNVKKYLSTR